MNEELGKCIAELNLAILKKIDERNKSLGIDLTPAHGAIIRAIIENGELCQKEIEGFVTCNKSTLSSILDTMERNELIIRKESEVDSRKKIICVTDKARKIHNIIESDRPYMNDILFKALSHEEYNSFIEIANKLKNAIERD